MHQRRKRAKPGDLLEISSTHGLAYVHFVGRHSEYGDAIFVYPRWHLARPSSLESICSSDGYLTFYPVQSAVRQGLVAIVGASPLPTNAVIPACVRRRGFAEQDGNVLAWIIERDGKETMKRKLTDRDRLLPIAAVWNHEYLIDRIAASWKPEQEG